MAQRRHLGVRAGRKGARRVCGDGGVACDDGDVGHQRRRGGVAGAVDDLGRAVVEAVEAFQPRGGGVDVGALERGDLRGGAGHGPDPDVVEAKTGAGAADQANVERQGERVRPGRVEHAVVVSPQRAVRVAGDRQVGPGLDRRAGRGGDLVDRAGAGRVEPQPLCEEVEVLGRPAGAAGQQHVVVVQRGARCPDPGLEGEGTRKHQIVDVDRARAQVQRQRVGPRGWLDGRAGVVERLGNAPVERVIGVARGQRRVGVADEPVLAVIGIGVDIAGRHVGLADPVALGVVGVAVAVILQQLVVGVGGVDRAQVAGEAVALLVIGIILDGDRRSALRHRHALVHLDQAVQGVVGSDRNFGLGEALAMMTTEYSYSKCVLTGSSPRLALLRIRSVLQGSGRISQEINEPQRQILLRFRAMRNRLCHSSQLLTYLQPI